MKKSNRKLSKELFLFSMLIEMLFMAGDLKSQELNTDVPILNHNLTFRYLQNEKNTLVFNLAYDHSLNDGFFWNETALNSAYIYSPKAYIDIVSSLYINYVNQSEDLTSNEVRPVLGFRIYRPAKYRLMLSNLSRIELRYINYSDDVQEWGARFRNMSHIFYSLNREAIFSNKNLIIYTWAEWFANFEQTRERFFNLFKAKLGLAYRFDDQWRIDFGVIYQDTKDNIGIPVNLPVDYNTQFIFEWRLTYTLFSKQWLNQ